MELERSSMSFREKSAWLSLAAIAITFGPYFAMIAAGVAPGDAVPNVPRLGILGAVLVIQVILMIGGHIVLAALNPAEAKCPPDERDRAIMHRSMTWAYYVLLSLVLVVGCVMPFNAGGWKIIDATLFSIVLAELVKYGVVVRAYRSQA